MTARNLIILSIIYLAFCAGYLLKMTSMTQAGLALDDSWIHQVFAKNLATGHGFSFNPDEPVAAATAPLWPLLLVPAWAVFGPVASGIILGLILQGLALFAVYKLAHLILDDNSLAFYATLFSILFWPVIWGALSGMETGLFSALSLWGLYYFFKSERLNDARRYAAYVLFTLSFLSRPECALFLAAALIHDFIINIKSGENRFLSWIIKFGIIIAFTAPYFIFNYVTAGSFFPNTFSIKVMGKDLISAVLRADLRGTLHALTVYPYFYLQHFYRKVVLINPLMVLALVPGIIILISIRGKDRSKRIMLALLFLFYVPLMGVFSPIMSAVWQNYRYVTNLLPLMMIIGIAGLFWKVEDYPAGIKKPLFIAASILLAAGIFLTFFFGAFSRTIIPLLVSKPSGLTGEGFLYLTGVIGRVGLGTILLGIMVFTGYIYTFRWARSSVGAGLVKGILLGLTMMFCLALTAEKSRFYADNVRNINDCDVAAGELLAKMAKPGDVVAVNDIGAIGYYSNMKIFDLWGLISREITADMVNNDSLTFEYMKKNEHVDYLAVFPSYFPHLTGRNDIFKPIKTFITENNTILGEDSTVVYKASWPDMPDSTAGISK